MAYKNYILVCAGTACESSKGIALYEALEKELREQGVDAEAQLVKTGCFGFCEQGPIVKILPDESFYVKVGPEHAKEIVSRIRAHRQGPCGGRPALRQGA
jgi:NADH:ubiquinone oxidoreductase subunit E